MTARDAATQSDPTDQVATPEDVDGGAPTGGEAGGAEATGDAADGRVDDAEADHDEAEEAEEADHDAEPSQAGPRRGRRRRRAAADAATEPATSEPATTSDDAADTTPATRRRRWPLVALIAVAAVFAGAMVVVYLVTRPAPVAGLSRPQQAAVDAASQAAVNLQTFRRASFDQDFANALASLTPQFAQEQLAPREAALKKQLTDGGRDATATALSAGLVSSTKTQAVVLVVTNTTQTADNGTSTPFVFSRLQLTLQLVDGKWLVSDLTSVGLS